MKKAQYLLLIFNILVLGTAEAIPSIPLGPQFPTIISNGNTYHVDKAIGDNSNIDGSSGNPWATLQHGINQLVPGDTLIVHEASAGYSEYVTISSAGVNNNWITIQGAVGENVVLQGGRITFSSAAKYIHFNNIDISVQNAGWLLLELKENSHHLVVDRVNINCQSSVRNYTGVQANAGVNNVWFKNMDIHHCGYKKTSPVTDCSAICMFRNSSAEPLLDEITFLNVTARDNKGDGIGGSNVDKVYFDGAVADNNTGDGFDVDAHTRAIFRNSIASNNGPEDQGAGFKTWSKESWFINCLVFNNASSGIRNKPNHLHSTIYVLNSTFVGNNKYKVFGEVMLHNPFAATDDPDLSSTDIYIRNNLFHTINTPAIAFLDWSNQTLVEESNNYFFSAQENDMPRAYNWAISLREGDTQQLYRPTQQYTFDEIENGVWFQDTGFGLNDIGKTKGASGLPDPGFVDLGNYDFNLQSGSEAIDSGIDIGLNADSKGNPILGSPDIGVYEFGHNDTDNDGLIDYDEVCIDGDCQSYNPYAPVTNSTGTDLDINKEDTDGDGYLDGTEIDLGSNPLDINSIPTIIADGDINLDRQVNVADFLLAQRSILNLTILSAEQIAHGDYRPVPSGDGELTIADLLLIVKGVIAAP